MGSGLLPRSAPRSEPAYYRDYVTSRVDETGLLADLDLPPQERLPESGLSLNLLKQLDIEIPARKLEADTATTSTG